MTKTEITIGANTTLTAFDGVSHECRVILIKARDCGELQRYLGEGIWTDFGRCEMLYGHLVYRVNPAAKAEKFYRMCKIGDNGTNYVYCDRDNGAHKQVYAAVGRLDFAGIQYEGCGDWLGILDPIKYGVPAYVRFVVE